MGMAWRAMQEADLDRVAAIAVIGFPDHFEGQDCFRNRLTLSPRGCLVLADGADVQGYLIAYPWIAAEAPSLNTLIAAIPKEASLLYLHDLALSPDVRGRGWSRSAMRQVVDMAKTGDWPAIALVAVNEAASFWGRYGFEVRETSALQIKLSSYGPDARYMIRAV